MQERNPFDDDPRPTTTRERVPRAEVLDDLDMPRTNQVPAVVPPPAGEYGGLFASVPREERDREAMLRAAEWVGSRMGDDAIYSWEVQGKRGKSLVEGPTIGLAYALAGEWGDTATRAMIIERTPTRAKFRGEFIDLQRRTVVVREYVFSLSPPPGKFAAGEQAQRWETMQEQAAASKAVRGAILAGLPAWLVEAAVAAAKETIRGAALPEVRDRETGEIRRLTLEEALGQAVGAFGKWGVSVAELEALTGQPRALWALSSLLQLRRTAAAIRSGETTADAAFAEVRAALRADARGEQVRSPAEDVAERIGMRRPAEPAPAAQEPPPAAPVAARPSVAETVQRTAPAEHEDPPRPARVAVAEPAATAPVGEPVSPAEAERRLLYAEIKTAASADPKGWQARTGRSTLMGVSRMGLDAMREIHAATFPVDGDLDDDDEVPGPQDDTDTEEPVGDEGLDF